MSMHSAEAWPIQPKSCFLLQWVLGKESQEPLEVQTKGSSPGQPGSGAPPATAPAGLGDLAFFLAAGSEPMACLERTMARLFFWEPAFL